MLAREWLVSGDRSVVDRWEYVRPFLRTYPRRPQATARSPQVSIESICMYIARSSGPVLAMQRSLLYCSTMAAQQQ